MSPDLTTLYHESLRPQFHFTARQWTFHKLNPGPHEEGWINDVNGLFYLDGEYHLFAQRWWSCWLHAISDDLVHWEEVQPAFGKGGEGYVRCCYATSLAEIQEALTRMKRFVHRHRK